MREVAGVPRLPSGAIARPRLLALLDRWAPITVVRGSGGLGKTTVLAQWVARLPSDHRPVWLTLDQTVRTRAGFWVRVLGALHRGGVAQDAALYRESAAIADDGGQAAAAIARALDGAGTVVLVLDDFGGPEPFWDEVCHDLLGLARLHPPLRCVVAGPTATLLESGRSDLAVEVVSDEELTLTGGEAEALVEASGLADAAATSRSLAGAAGSAEELRYALDLHERTGTRLENAAAVARRTSSPPDGAGIGLAIRLHDHRLLDFTGRIALAPYVDHGLANVLAGADAAGLLRRLARDEVGHWSTDADGVAVFRLSEHIREAAAAHLQEARPQEVPRLLARIARWLAVDRGDLPAAAEYAVRAGDLDFADRVMMRAYPLSHEDHRHLAELLETRLGAGPPDTHPFLALTYALYLNADPARRGRAPEYFAAAAEASRRRTARASAIDRVITHGLQTTAYRLLGSRRRMVETARWALRSLADARSEPIDPVHGQTLAVAVGQAAASLLSADELAGAAAGFEDLAHLAAQHRWGHFGNFAGSGLAAVAVLQGRLTGAREALARLRRDAWPEPWYRGYSGALRALAQAWVHLDAGEPEAALAELSIVAPHESTIEFWDVLGSARALARAMQGEAAAAALELAQLRARREDAATLPAVLVRLSVIQGILELAQGRAVDPPMAGAGASRRALRAVAAAARGEQERALTHLASAEAAAATPVQEVFAVVAGVVLAERTATGLSLPTKGRRLAGIVSGHGLRWPLVLLAERDRERILGALREPGDAAGRAALAGAFATVPALVGEQLWQGGQVPPLTPREREVLVALAATGQRSEIAARLHVSVNTVKAQLRSLYAKLGVSTREAALTRALNLGLLRAPDGGS